MVVPSDPSLYADHCPRYVPSDGTIYLDNNVPSVVPGGYTYVGPSPSAPPQKKVEAWYQSGSQLVDPGFKYLWGGPDPTVASARSPLYGVLYNAFGWDGALTNKRIYKKSTNFLLDHGVPQGTIDAFQAYSYNYLASNPANAGQLGRDIDTAMAERLAAFRACGPGTWQYNASNAFNPGDLTINFHGIPFDVGAGVWVGGATRGDLNLIDCVVVHVNNYVPGGNPANSILSGTAPAFLKWEIGNFIAWKGGYIPNASQSPKHDLGGNDPCLCPSKDPSTCYNNA